MSRMRLTTRALLVVLASGAPAPLWAQDAPVAVESMAVTTLLRQAERWLARSRPDLASQSVERALTAEPTNVAALRLAARIEQARNNREASLAYLRRMQAAATTPEERQAASDALRNATVDPSLLQQARDLARQGRAEEAASRYRALFANGGPPTAYASEYYQALSGAPTTRAEGLAGLGQLASRPGADAATQLAAAQALTFQEATRGDGISQLGRLAGQPDVATAARNAWRQALGFYGADPVVLPLMQSYLQRYPDDTEMAQRLATLRQAQAQAQAAAPAPGPGDALRREGFAQLETGTLRAGAARFEAALALNPNDTDALGGLGLVRLRENRPDLARPLLERAIAADPGKAAQWQRALDGAGYGTDLADARALLARGDAAGADAILRRALGRDVDDHTDAESLLGETALRQGDASAAEQHFRAALSRRPGFPPAVNGLNQALRAQNKIPAPRVTTASDTNQGTPTPPPGRVGQLRTEAAGSTDPAVAITLLRSAVNLAPADPWARLDLARLYRRQGRGGEARALVEEIAARDNTPDSRFAAALLAQEDGRLDDADAELNAIPPLRRSPDMARLQARIRTDRDIKQAAAGLAGGAGRQDLMQIAARPDPSGAGGAAVIRAFGVAGDRTAASEAARVTLAANPGAGPAARLAVAGALLASGAEPQAAQMADQLAAAPLSPDQRRDLAALRNGLAIRASDTLNEAGAQGQAFERLRPVLAADPDSPDAQLALARLYQGNRQPAAALRLARAVLARDPANLNAREGAITAAIAMGDHRTANDLIAEAQTLGPADSRVMLMQARVARAFGEDTRAQALLQSALAQRQAELGTSTASLALPPGGDLVNPFLTPNQVATAASTSDPVSRQIAQELTGAENKTAPVVALGATVHTRSGSAGLDQLAAISGSVEGSVPVTGIGGQLSAQATPVVLNSGQISSSLSTLYRFGTNSLAGTTPVAPKNTTATGVGLAIAYALTDSVKFNVGTTPLGFKIENVLGGFEIAPRLTDKLRLRVTADRHAVTDSLLSWAGLTDPSSRTTWGGVISTGGRAQIEGPIGAGSAYIGGGYARLTGTHVANNNRVEAGAGFSYPLMREGSAELTAGTDLVYFGFSNNQRAFTLGNGGYFSPQSYGALNIPIDYRNRVGNLAYHVGATVGYASFRENTSPVFPVDANLQSQLETAAVTNALLSTRTPALTRNGFIGGIRVDLAYDLTPTLKLSGLLRYDQAPQFNDTNVVVRLQNRF